MHSVKLNILENDHLLGTISIDGGELINASDESGEGEEAFRRLLLKKGTRIESEYPDDEDKKRTIQISCEELIFKIFTTREKEKSLLGKGPEPGKEPSPAESKINKGMNLLLAKNYQAAKLLFTEVLEEDPGNEKAKQVLKRLKELL